MRSRIILPMIFAAGAVMFAQTLPQGVQQKASVGGITEYDYPNGLRVLLFPDPASPKVTVNMTYMVGSRFEGYGESGMAHLLEHMNFILSTNGRNIKKELTDHGAQWNGTTYYDRTNYFETVTASDDNLKWALGLEAERMVNMRIEKELLDTEMTVVRNEFERGENSPERILFERVMSTAYLWHNYGKSVIGSRADIEKVPIDRLAAFYTKYYQPDNAVLVIAGQFDQAKALDWVAQTCGAIPRPTRKLDEFYTEEPVQDGERYVALKRVGENPEVMIAWHGPSASQEDMAALDVLSGVLAGDGASGRLYKALVDNKKALTVGAGTEELHDPGIVVVDARLSKDQSLDDARKLLLDTVAGLVSEPPTKDEVEKEKKRLLDGIERALSNSQQAALGLSEAIASGDWRLFFLQYDRVKNVMPDDIVRVAKLYFKDSNRTIGEFIPTALPDRTQVPASPDVAALFTNYTTSMKIEQGEQFDPAPSNIEKRLMRMTLPAGLKVAMLPKTNRGATVSVTVQLQFGGEPGSASERSAGTLTASLLMRGTKSLSRQQIQDEMVKLKAQIRITGSLTNATVTAQTTQDNLIPTLRLVAEILRDPSFPDTEFDSGKKQMIATLEENKTNPDDLAGRALNDALRPFPKDDLRHYRTTDELIEDANKVTLDDVRKFHAKYYGASHGELVIVGQFDAATVSKIASELFGSWASPAPYRRIVTDAQKVAPVNVKIETLDKQNSRFEAGLEFPMTDADPDYPAMLLANYIFGGSITGRVPDRIRNREGLSYSVRSTLQTPQPADGNLTIFGGFAISNPKNAPKVEASFKDELARTLSGGFTSEEVATVKKALLESRQISRSQDASLLTLILNNEDAARTLAWDEQIDSKLAALTADQVNAAFRRHVDASALSIVKAGDFKAAGVYQ